jgi:hypothetical protein
MASRVSRRRRAVSGLLLSLCLLSAVAATEVAQAQARRTEPEVPAGTGKIFLGTYGGDIRVVDEATGKVEERIPLKVDSHVR